MVTRKAYVDWKRLDRNSVLESGKDYLCFAGDPAAMAGSIFFAKYYKQGDAVKLPLRPDYNPGDEEPTVEQRLLSAIFGRYRQYVVPMDGLYEQTGDYGVDEKCENGAFEGCSEQLVMAGNALPDGAEGAAPVFWAECPLLPPGYRLLDSVRPRTCIDASAAMDLRSRLEGDSDAMYAYQGLCGHGGDRQAALPGDEGMCDAYVQGAVCAVTPVAAASLVLDVTGAARKMAAVGLDAVKGFIAEFESMKDREAASRLWNEFREKHGLTVKEGSYALKYLSALSDTCPGFYACRDRILARGGIGSMDTVKIVVEAWGASQLPNRLRRLVDLTRLGAPGVILENELRMACEYAAAWRFADDIARVTPGFATSFGINPDGTRSGACTKVGDAELLHEYLVSQECDHDCANCDVDFCDERDGGIPGLEPDPEPEDEDAPAGDRYAMAYMPNFMMHVPGAVIIDSETETFVRGADGAIEIWTTCPRDRLDELNGRKE